MASGARLLKAKHGSGVPTATFDPSGTLAVTGSSDHTAAVWRVSTGARLLSVRHVDGVNAVASN